ncbi:MAG: hypothetical protein IPM64_00670 [Phycisphaerales bacterium]|nr:hypothetical protein [Phycisphaerales bacterium]
MLRVARPLVPLLIVAVTVAVFLPAATSGNFVDYDDEELFLSNPLIRSLAPGHLLSLFGTFAYGHYQPLTWISHAIDFQLSGTRAYSHHAGNVALHALNGVLVYLLGLRLIAAARAAAPAHLRALDPSAGAAAARFAWPAPMHRSGPSAVGVAAQGASLARLRPSDLAAAGVAALLFAIHPLRAESVAWATERRDVLSTALLLGAAIAYVRAVAGKSAPLAAPRALVPAVLLLTLSLTAKAWGMTFFLLALLLDVFPLRRLPPNPLHWWKSAHRAVLREKLPFVLLGVAAAVTAAAAQRAAPDTMRTLEQWGLLERLVQAVYGLHFYLASTIWPSGLAVLHELPYRLNPLDGRFVMAYATVPIGLLLTVLVARRVPAVGAAAAAYVILLLPVLGLAQSGPQLVADRYSYVSCIGWMLVIGGGLAAAWRPREARGARRAGIVLSCAILFALGVLCRQQVRVWRDSDTLWAHAFAVGAHSAIGHGNTALRRLRAGDAAAALEHAQRAAEVRPDYAPAWVLQGRALRSMKRVEEAAEAYERGLATARPRHLLHTDLGMLLLHERSDGVTAAEHFRAAVAIGEENPAYRAPAARLGLGMALRISGDLPGAREALRAAARHPATREAAERELRMIGGE